MEIHKAKNMSKKITKRKFRLNDITLGLNVGHYAGDAGDDFDF